GDQMLMLIRVKDDMIVDVRWKTYGCASAIASTSILSETIKGMLISEAVVKISAAQKGLNSKLHLAVDEYGIPAGGHYRGL
uniref:iron-sulfur cluster assembly scaffold protein n=1 Tax=Treponema endosymbiont of Eucomonympha sp. TaxID=1580831 RepID=UPI000A64EEF6